MTRVSLDTDTVRALADWIEDHPDNSCGPGSRAKQERWRKLIKALRAEADYADDKATEMP